jgi:peptidoglycan/LPS O-acetylase OafA/YrhL
VLTNLGKWSFSICRWQQPFFYAAGTRNDYVQNCLLVAFAVCVGILSFHLFEAPVRELINRKWAAKSAQLQYNQLKLNDY